MRYAGCHPSQLPAGCLTLQREAPDRTSLDYGKHPSSNKTPRLQKAICLPKRPSFFSVTPVLRHAVRMPFCAACPALSGSGARSNRVCHKKLRPARRVSRLGTCTRAWCSMTRRAIPCSCTALRRGRSTPSTTATDGWECKTLGSSLAVMTQHLRHVIPLHMRDVSLIMQRVSACAWRVLAWIWLVKRCRDAGPTGAVSFPDHQSQLLLGAPPVIVASKPQSEGCMYPHIDHDEREDWSSANAGPQHGHSMKWKCLGCQHGALPDGSNAACRRTT